MTERSSRLLVWLVGIWLGMYYSASGWSAIATLGYVTVAFIAIELAFLPLDRWLRQRRHDKIQAEVQRAFAELDDALSLIESAAHTTPTTCAVCGRLIRWTDGVWVDNTDGDGCEGASPHEPINGDHKP